MPISRPKARPGSIRSSASSPRSRTGSFVGAHTAVPSNWSAPFAITSTSRTATRSPSCGPRPLTRSLPPSNAFVSESLGQDTSPENSRTMKEKSHRAARRCYESGVETLQGTQTRRLDGYSLYSAQRSPGPRDFEADHRPVRPAASQFRRRRRSAESVRRSARADVATGQRDPRPSPSRQGGAPAPGSAAAARLRAGLWLRRLQRRRAAGRRPDPQAAAPARSARGGGLGVATDAVAVRERRGSGRPLSP